MCVGVCVVHVCLCVHVFSVHKIFVCQYVYMWVYAREYRRGARERNICVCEHAIQSPCITLDGVVRTV